MKVKRESEVAQSCWTLSNPMDRSLPGSSVHGIFQVRVLIKGKPKYINKINIKNRKQGSQYLLRLSHNLVTIVDSFLSFLLYIQSLIL